MTTVGSTQPRRRYRFGEFEFDSRTGRLTRRGANDDGINLSPQPAELLHLLLQRDGDLVSRDEIRSALWPDVHVDFDQSLNFCIHQVRTALGDSAVEPSYVETLPRRGYRLLQPVHDGGAEARKPRRWRPVAGAVGLIAALALTAILVGPLARGGVEPPATIAIMPFEPPEGQDVPGDPTRIAEALLLDLGSLGASRLGVIGPATTRAYAGDSSLARLIEATGVDWVINDRFIASSTNRTGTGLLIELIRATDGVHVWVESIDDATATEEIADRVGNAVREALGLEVPVTTPPD